MSCPDCDKVYATVYDLKRHAVHHDESLKPRCGVCDRVFTTKVNLRKHVEKYHKGVSVGGGICDSNGIASSAAVRKSRAPVAGQPDGRRLFDRGVVKSAAASSVSAAAPVAKSSDEPVRNPLRTKGKTASTTTMITTAATTTTAASADSAADTTELPTTTEVALRSNVLSRVLTTNALAEWQSAAPSSSRPNAPPSEGDAAATGSFDAAASSHSDAAASSSSHGGGLAPAPTAGAASTRTTILSPTEAMAELTSTGAHFDDGEPQLATLELVTSEEHGDGTSLTLALQPLSSKDRPDFVLFSGRKRIVLYCSREF